MNFIFLKREKFLSNKIDKQRTVNQRFMNYITKIDRLVFTKNVKYWIFYVFARKEINERKIKPDIPKFEVRNSTALERGASPRNPSS